MDKQEALTIQQALKKYFGFSNFKGNQEAIIKNVLAGRDSFVLMPTGGGKSLCYQLPSLLMEGTAIVISPLIALMKNQVDSMRAFSGNDGIAHFLNSSLNKTQINQVKKDLIEGTTKLLYVAPESLTKEDNVKFLRNVKIAFYAVDEAHCISEWGHDFRPEYRRIRPIINEIGNAPVIALTATATPKVQLDIQKTLGMLEADVFKSSFRRANLYYEVKPKKNISREMIRYIKDNPGKAGIIYCLSRKKVEELAETLKVNGIKALPYHAGMDAATRTRHQDMFLMEDVEVIVATIAFGMGIDKPDVRFVMHHDIPKSLEGYYQETGRAGRDGGEGKCFAFYSYKDIQKLEKFMQGKPVAEQEIGRQLLNETVAYAETSACRVRMLLNYFGEEMTENCGNCDNCLKPRQEFEGMEYVVTALNAVLAVKEKFKIDHVAKVLAGNKDTMVKSYKHHELDVFGIDDEKDAKFWNMVLRRGLIAKLLDKDIENYGLLFLTEKGKNYINNPYSIMLSEDHEYAGEDDEESSTNGSASRTGAVDSELFDMLKDLRKKNAKKLNLPPFVIFQDPSLEDMASQYPVTMDELQNISGVGTGKANRFGKDFIELIKKYVEDRDIIRPNDMIVKSIVNKSGSKVYIIQSIDRKMPLEDIAAAKNIEMGDLLNEIESIVNSGTKLDISYYIDQILDEDHQEEVIEYFREEAENESITDALQELGEDEYSEEDIRLMRIKFISEFGN
ncbi:MAG: DNA helicase RecQ [Bacteroidetes bacterium]|jgi:ATP-dependent DNA helicase RecQ|nr:DNA helicase RecQ [Bacteroidota bacterium]